MNVSTTFDAGCFQAFSILIREAEITQCLSMHAMHIRILQVLSAPRQPVIRRALTLRRPHTFTAQLLDTVHRLVRSLEQHVDILPMVGAQRHADAAGYG